MARIIKNTADLNVALNTAMLFAIKKVQDRVYDVIQNFIKDYYHDYSPVVYQRTYDFFNSLTKSEIKKVSNGYVCEVYIDMSQMDYYRHEAIEVVDMINRGFHADTGMNGGERIHNGIYSDPYNAPYDITVMGEQSDGMHFWDDSMAIFKHNDYILTYFMDYMKKAGFNVVKK